jgi:hypothetical protein
MQGFVPGSYMQILKDSEMVKSVTVLNDLPILPSPALELAKIEELQTPLRDAMDTHDLKSIKSNARSASSRTDNESEDGSEETFSDSESETDSEDDQSVVDVDETSGTLVLFT